MPNWAILQILTSQKVIHLLNADLILEACKCGFWKITHLAIGINIAHHFWRVCVPYHRLVFPYIYVYGCCMGERSFFKSPTLLSATLIRQSSRAILPIEFSLYIAFSLNAVYESLLYIMHSRSFLQCFMTQTIFSFTQTCSFL